MKTRTTLLGQAEKNATQEFLQDRFAKWKYSSIWKKQILPNEVSSTLLGIEFKTTDFSSLQQNFSQLLMMGCNHFQWVIKEPEELAFIKQSPFSVENLQSISPLVTRQSIVLSLRILPTAASNIPLLIEQSAEKVEIEKWDRVWIPLDSYKATQSLPNNIGLSISEEFFSKKVSLNEALPNSEISEKIDEIISICSDSKPLQISLPLKSFTNLLSHNEKNKSENLGADSSAGTTQDGILSLFDKLNVEISFRAMSLEEAGEGYTVLQSSTDKMKVFQQHVQTLLALLKADEKKLNIRIFQWLNTESQSERNLINEINLAPFDFIKSLKEACEAVENITNWEQYLSELWFPSFQHHVRSWTPHIPDDCQKQWRWMIDQMMEHVHELLGIQAQTIRMKQAQELLPYLQVLDQNFPKLPSITTIGAKYLFLLASTPWPETVIFPWNTLDNAIGHLGLMRLPHLENVDYILRKLLETSETQ